MNSDAQAANTSFWHMLDRLVASSEIVIDRPKGTAHPRYSDFIYPFDYGYMKDTHAGDGDGIDVWLGSLPEKSPTAIVFTLDLLKRDAEVKVLLGCTRDEMHSILAVHQQFTQGAMLIERH